MLVNSLLKERNMTRYQLAKLSSIPKTTINDLCIGKSKPDKCSAATIYKLSKALGVPMERLVEPYIEKRCSFELFKSNVCHSVKDKGDIQFLIDTLKEDEIRRLYQMEWYPESLYLLSMIDYLSRINDVPLCFKYEDLRKLKLKDTVYPSSVSALAYALKDEQIKVKAKMESIPEFLNHNIVENEVRNVV